MTGSLTCIIDPPQMATTDLGPTVVNSVVSLRGQGNDGVEQMLGKTSLDEVT